MILKKVKGFLRGEREAPQTADKAASSADREFELEFFRPRNEIADPPYGITGVSTPEVDDARLVTRLLAAYRRAHEEHEGCGASMWQGFFDAMQTPLDEAFRSGTHAEATRLLRDPSASNHFYGFDNLCAALADKFLPPSMQAQSALACLAGLVRLGEAMGIVCTWNPEYPPLASRCWTAEEMLAALEQRLGIEIVFPNPYPKEVGLQTSRGLVSYRAVQALYQAWRIRELVRSVPRPRVLEVGAGLGRTAYYARLLGIEDYTLVDIPLSMIAQGYFVGRCLGEAEVEFMGEMPAAGPRVRFVSPKTFLGSSDRYDLIVNIDSMTEFAPEAAHSYLKRIADASPLFLSINHENNAETMAEMFASLPSAVDVQRSLYWMRRGYVEEIARFGPSA